MIGGVNFVFSIGLNQQFTLAWNCQTLYVFLASLLVKPHVICYLCQRKLGVVVEKVQDAHLIGRYS